MQMQQLKQHQQYSSKVKILYFIDYIIGYQVISNPSTFH
jgi:hypothetical protein